MTITRADVADLRAGDVVEYAGHSGLRGAKIVGPLYDGDGILAVGSYVVRFDDGAAPGNAWGDLTLTVISRAKPPLYVNSDKTEPDPGDVVRDADSDDNRVWMLTDPGDPSEAWTMAFDGFWCSRSEIPARLRLLVDGRTGQVVP